MCKITIVKFTCGHIYERPEMCDWMKLRPERDIFKCPYRDPNGVRINEQIKCHECATMDPEIPSHFRDSNIIKRAPPPERALANGNGIMTGIGGALSMTREERRRRIAERYGVYSIHDVPGYRDPEHQTVSQTPADVSRAEPTIQSGSRRGKYREYGAGFAYGRLGAPIVTQHRTRIPPAPTTTTTGNPETREKLTWFHPFWDAAKLNVPTVRNGWGAPQDPTVPPSYSAEAMKMRARGAKPGDPPPETDPKIRTIRDIARTQLARIYDEKF
ncbi:hypothetical protein TWF481_007769 [Arthrobotrys musiformis]|uniref:Uncharacterized protein n=1 Tax=Arthrobotrys musiformis TaxID=47236 RepID=A0AAV9WCG2_9PEZI